MTNNLVDWESIKIAFTGDGFDGSMDASDFASTIAAFVDVFKETHKTLTNEKDGLKVRITSSLKNSSYEAEIKFKIKTYIEESTISEPKMKDLLFGSEGYIRTIITHKGLPEIKETDVNEEDYYKKELYQNDKLLESLANIFRVLKHQDNTVEFRDESGTAMGTVTKEEAAFFSKSKTENYTEDVYNDSLIIMTIHLNEKGKKWRFRSGKSVPFSALVKDEDFWSGINQGDSFSQGDTVDVEMMTRKYEANKPDEYTIVEVLNHQSNPDQRELFEEDGNDNEVE